LILIPSAISVLSKVFLNLFIVNVYAGIYTMLRSFIVIFCTILAIPVVKNKFYSHHIASLSLIVLGIILCGLSILITLNYYSINFFAVLIILDFFLLALGYVIEEKFLKEYESVDPYQLAGLEGAWSFLMWLVVLTIL
jgi:hypothetical protein